MKKKTGTLCGYGIYFPNGEIPNISRKFTRTPSTMDQRKIIIQLTDQGWAMRESAAEIPLKLMSKLNLEVSDVQIAEALHLKNKLYELIKVLDKSSN